MKLFTWDELKQTLLAEGVVTQKELETIKLCEEDEVKIFAETEVVTVAKDIRESGESKGYMII